MRENLPQRKKIHPYTKMLESANLAIIVCADVNLQTGVSKGFFPQDCAAATQNMLLQSTELNLGTCWCGIYPKEKLVESFREMFELEENIIPFDVIAIGVPNEEFGSRGFYEEGKVKWID